MKLVAGWLLLVAGGVMAGFTFLMAIYDPLLTDDEVFPPLLFFAAAGFVGWLMVRSARRSKAAGLSVQAATRQPAPPPPAPEPQGQTQPDMAQTVSRRGRGVSAADAAKGLHPALERMTKPRA